MGRLSNDGTCSAIAASAMNPLDEIEPLGRQIHGQGNHGQPLRVHGATFELSSFSNSNFAMLQQVERPTRGEVLAGEPPDVGDVRPQHRNGLGPAAGTSGVPMRSAAPRHPLTMSRDFTVARPERFELPTF